MPTARNMLERTAQRIADNPDQAREVGAVYRLSLDGEGGGRWIIDLRDEPGVREGAGEADCGLSMAASDYVDLVEGRVSAQQLFFNGKLRVEGDMGLAVKLQKLQNLLR
ncbi:MAG: SCP2 sterol-binding domain-containing protein [Polyangiaceae bacterium]|nr:SCP2 sterol-binding domain-containing protein [Polyangiaceae bacterium]